MFAAKGLQTATLREIAREADVDPALISHYFGNKNGLFLEAVEFPLDPDEILAPLREVAPGRLAETALHVVLRAWDGEAGPATVAAFRSTIEQGDEALCHDFVAELVAAPLRERLADQDRLDVRLALFSSQIAGLLLMRKVMGMSPLSTMPASELVPMVAPTLQRYLTGTLTGA